MNKTNKKDNKRKTVRPDSISGEILTLLGELGEFSFESLELYFYDRSRVVIQNELNKLVYDGFITIVGKENDKLTSIRLRKPKGLDFIKNQSIELYNHYLKVTNNHKFQTTNLNSTSSLDVLRKHKISAASIFFKLIGASTGINNPQLSLTRENDVLDIPVPAFYTSIELKNLDASQKHKTEFTRMVGCFFVNKTAYMIYNICNNNIKWNQQGEQKAQLLIKDVIKFNSRENDWKIHAILLGNSMDDLYQNIFSSEVKNSKYEFLSFFNVFKNVYILPLTLEGLRVGTDFLIDNIHNKLKYDVFGKDLVISSEDKLDCDCDIVDGETRALCFLSGNVARLKRFCEFAELSQATTKYFQVFCYDFQEDFLQKVCPFNVEIVKIE